MYCCCVYVCLLLYLTSIASVRQVVFRSIVQWCISCIKRIVLTAVRTEEVSDAAGFIDVSPLSFRPRCYLMRMWTLRLIPFRLLRGPVSQRRENPGTGRRYGGQLVVLVVHYSSSIYSLRSFSTLIACRRILPRLRAVSAVDRRWCDVHLDLNSSAK